MAEVVNATKNDYEDIRDRLRNIPTYKEQLKAQFSLCDRVCKAALKERDDYISANGDIRASAEYESRFSELNEAIDKANREYQYMQGKYEEACDQFKAVLAEAAMFTALVGVTVE
jgi:predicted  nucleic acid-binding Zn-ribbon protein